MEVKMDQSEIDALFASARAETVQNPASLPAERKAPERKGEPYHFNRTGQISNEQMKAISTVNDLFARNLTHALGAWLRTQFQVTLAAGEQLMYAEFLERVPDLAYICSARLEPLDVAGVIQLDLALAPPIVDLLLGGVGSAGPLAEPTEIEAQILISVMEIVVRELNLAWRPVGLTFSLDRRETGPQAKRMMAPAEKLLCVSFEIRMPSAQGMLNLCLPAVVLNTILRRLISDRGRPRRRSAEARQRMTELMNEAKFAAILQFAPMRLQASELASLAPGYCLRLPLPRHGSSELRVGGLPLFRAQPVRSGEHRGAQVKGYSADAERAGGSR